MGWGLAIESPLQPPLAPSFVRLFDAGRGEPVYLPQVSSVHRVANNTGVMAPGLSIPAVVDAQMYVL